MITLAKVKDKQKSNNIVSTCAFTSPMAHIKPSLYTTVNLMRISNNNIKIATIEIKRYLILGRKARTNLDSILKSRDITLSTKVCICKAIIFPVVMNGCESCTIKKVNAEKLMLLNCGVGEDT